jgi:hypothetical protein
MSQVQLKDAEAIVYAFEASVCFCTSVASGNYGQAALDFIMLAGWVKNAIATSAS